MAAIAIDGPAGAGKSTVAKRVAGKLGFVYVDTGAMYRAMALHMLRKGVDVSDEAAVAKESEGVEVGLAYEDGQQAVLLFGENVNGLIRTEEVSAAASNVSAVDSVRKRLLELQRGMARDGDVVMDGRDIGTVVLPDARCKIFLTAKAEVRAHRRWQELQERGEDVCEADILADITARDERDRNREIAPLRQADDAVLVDTSDMDADEVVERILAIWRES